MIKKMKKERRKERKKEQKAGDIRRRIYELQAENKTSFARQPSLC